MRRFIYITMFSLCFGLSNIVYAQTILKQDGKYGLSDEKGNILVKPLCDTIYNFFPHMKNVNKASVEMYALKQNGKYAFAVMENWQSQENRSGGEGSLWRTTDMNTDSVRWNISFFVYDTLFPLNSFSDVLNYDANNFEYFNRKCRFFRRTFWLLGYSKDKKQGIISIDAIACGGAIHFSKSGVVTDTIQYSIENIVINPAKYANISYFKYVKYGTLHMDYVLTQNSFSKYGLIDPKIQFELEPQFDSPPEYLSIVESPNDNFMKRYFVKKNNKWGIMTINFKTNKLEYPIPCEYTKKPEQIKNERSFFLCEDSSKNSFTIYDINNYKTFELIHTSNSKFYSTLIEYDTIPDKETGWYNFHKKYIVLKGKNWEFLKTNEIYIIDLKNEKIKAVYNDTTANYDYHESPLGVLIIKKTNLDKENLYEYFDLETGENIFSLRLSKNIVMGTYQTGTDYPNRKALIEKDGTYSYHYNTCKLQVYMVVVVIENGKKDKVIGYYDFLSKKFYKKKPPKINGRC